MDKKQWFRTRKWGVFFHYLEGLQNNPASVNSDGKHTGWDECVNELDTERIAAQLHEANAGYAAITVMQGTRFMIAPNETYDRLTGLQPGEACSRRDLIGDLIRALSKYDIPLFLYYTGDGPFCDEDTDVGEKMQAPRIGDRPITAEFIDRWTAVLREYSLRYGSKIKGWWVDGLFSGMYPGLDNAYIGKFKEAALAGNPDALFAANYFGVCKRTEFIDIPGYGSTIFGEFFHEIQPPTKFCDYTAGEANSFDLYPAASDVEGAVPHVFSFLGIPNPPVAVYGGWGAPGTKYSGEYMRRYIECVNTIGGVVTIDCCLHRDGQIDAQQFDLLRSLKSIR